MNMQALMDVINAASKDTRSDYHVTLGKMIEKAAQAAQADGNVRFADGGSPGEEMSYRGYYSDLSFEPADEEKSAADFLAQCKRALGQEYDGYKGGDYLMEEATPLWRAEYGTTGEAIVRAVVEPNGDLVLHCLPEDD